MLSEKAGPDITQPGCSRAKEIQDSSRVSGKEPSATAGILYIYRTLNLFAGAGIMRALEGRRYTSRREDRYKLHARAIGPIEQETPAGKRSLTLCAIELMARVR